MAVVTLADIKIEAANPSIQSVKCGEALVAGDLVYWDADSSSVFKCDASDAAKDAIFGLVLLAGDVNKYTIVAKNGTKLNTSTVLVVGQNLVAAGTGNEGDIEPFADLAVGEYISYLGTPDTTSTLLLDFNITELTKD